MPVISYLSIKIQSLFISFIIDFLFTVSTEGLAYRVWTTVRVNDELQAGERLCNASAMKYLSLY